MPPLPDRARVVVIGGGVIGASIAYHLAHLGVTDVLVLERDRLTSGSTWHAAGLMTTFGSTSETLTGMRLYSRDLYARLEAETGLSTGFRPVGLIEAADECRLEEYRRVAVFQRHLGLEVEEVTPAEMIERFPWATTDGLVAGFWVPGDGRVNPVDATMSLARGARNLGVRVIEQAAVERVLTRQRGAVEQVTGVRAKYQGESVDIECERVVNCAGMWARELAGRNGVVVPNQAAEHYYLITDTIDGIDPDGPIFEDPSSCAYYREEGGGMMVGLFEPDAAPWAVDHVPESFSFGTIPADWERMAPVLERAMSRVPATLEVGVRTLFCGPESFTPDLLPAVGEAPGVEGYFVCAGLNSVGILSAGGMGQIVAHWVATGAPDVDTSAFGVARFRSWQLDPRYRAERTSEVLGTVYTAHPPGRELHSGRGLLVNPLRDRLVAEGAWLRDVSGFESAGWYAGRGQVAQAEPGWGRQPWHEHWAAEHRAVREGVGVIDMSFMTHLRVTGPDAERVLSWLSAGEIGQAGRVTYTPWLRDDGRIDADLTVTWLGEEDFHVIASDTTRGHVEALLRRGVGEAVVEVEDLTESWAQVNVVGPVARDVLAGLTTADLSDAAFPFRAARQTQVAGAEVILQRVTYFGELGFELHLPGDRAAGVWDALLAAGAAYGIRPVGLAALGSLRLERAYRDWGHDIDMTDDVHGAGLGFTVAWDKDFRGREAAAVGRGVVPSGRLVQVLLTDPEPLLHHAEVVLRDGAAVGLVRSASYGWTLGGAVGLAFVECAGGVTPEWLAAGAWEVDVAGRRVPSRVSLSPMYAGGR